MIPLGFEMIFRAGSGQTNTELSEKGVCTAPDYKAMYLELFRASEQAARLLWEAQQRAEQQLLEESPPPLRLDTNKGSPDRGAGNADRH